MDREQPTDEQKLGLLERVRQDGDTEALDELLQLNDFSKAALLHQSRQERLIAQAGPEILTGATWKAALSQALFATIRAIPTQPGGEIDTAGAEAHCKRYGLDAGSTYQLLYRGYLRSELRDYLEQGWLDGQTLDQYESGNTLDDPYNVLPDDVVDAIISLEDIDRWVYIVFEPLAVGKSFTRIEQYRDNRQGRSNGTERNYPLLTQTMLYGAGESTPTQHCELCDNRIHPDRIAVLPNVKLCIHCAKQHKPKHERATRAAPIARGNTAKLPEGDLLYRQVLTDFGKAWGDRPRFVGGFWHELPEETVEQEYRARRRWHKYLPREAVSIHEDVYLEDSGMDPNPESIEVTLSPSAGSPAERQRRFKAMIEDACLELAGGDGDEAEAILELVTAQTHTTELESDGQTPLQTIADERGITPGTLRKQRQRYIERMRKVIGPDPTKYLLSSNQRES